MYRYSLKLFPNHGGIRNATPLFTTGFTLVEILIAIAVIAVIVLIIAGGLRSFRESSDLNRAADGAVASLRDARRQTLESKDASAWGAHLESGRIVLFKGAAFPEGAPDNVVFTLPGTVTLSWNLSGGGQDIKFKRISGDTDQTGTLTFSLTSNPAKTRTVGVLSSGLVEVQ